MQREVVFVTWVDPFLYPDTEHYDEFENEQEWDFARRNFITQLRPSEFRGRYLISPVCGFMPLTDANSPSKRHKMVEGHTNFRLEDSDEATIEATAGVDGLRVLSPYSFLLRIGWVFNADDVKAAIKARLCPAAPPPREKKPAADPLLRAATRFPCWAVVKTANGRDLVGGKTREEVEGRLAGRAVLEKSWKQ